MTDNASDRRSKTYTRCRAQAADLPTEQLPTWIEIFDTPKPGISIRSRYMNRIAALAYQDELTHRKQENAVPPSDELTARQVKWLALLRPAAQDRQLMRYLTLTVNEGTHEIETRSRNRTGKLGRDALAADELLTVLELLAREETT